MYLSEYFIVYECMVKYKRQNLFTVGLFSISSVSEP